MVEFGDDEQRIDIKFQGGKRLGEYLSENPALRVKFERAAKVKIRFNYGFNYLAPKGMDTGPVTAALQKLADELNTIPKERFDAIVGMLKK